VSCGGFRFVDTLESWREEWQCMRGSVGCGLNYTYREGGQGEYGGGVVGNNKDSD